MLRITNNKHKTLPWKTYKCYIDMHFLSINANTKSSIQLEYAIDENKINLTIFDEQLLLWRWENR